MGLDEICVRANRDDPCRGALTAGGDVFAVALGRGGIAREKREGDGVTPAGRFALREVRYRADRLDAPDCGLPLSAIGPRDGWSDDPADPHYNRLVRHPEEGERALSAERLWREDHLYDVIVVVGHNDAPPVPGAGSAIFMHLAREGYTPTEGCVALARDDLVALLARLGPQTELVIEA